MDHCQDCKYFTDPDPEGSYAGTCHSAARLEDVKRDHPQVKTLFVTPDYGCQHFEAKPIG